MLDVDDDPDDGQPGLDLAVPELLDGFLDDGVNEG